MNRNSLRFPVSSRRLVQRKYIIILITLSLFLAGCTKREIKNTASTGKTIVCFGDSITFGYGVETHESYPAELGRKLNLKIINAGLDGNTSTRALERIERDVLSEDPYLVIVEFGGNDFVTKIPLETTVNNINKIVEQVQAKGAMVCVVDISAGMLFAEYHAPYKKIAQDSGSIFVPASLKHIITNPQLKSDFIHPNAKGYKIIAERIYQQIKPYVRK